MPHRLHAALAVLVEVLGFLAGGALALRFLESPLGVVAWIPWLFLLAAAVLVPRTLWRRFVPARCPACSAARAFLRGTHPWCYACRACGHVHETSLSDGGGPSLHGESEADARRFERE